MKVTKQASVAVEVEVSITTEDIVSTLMEELSELGQLDCDDEDDNSLPDYNYEKIRK